MRFVRGAVFAMSAAASTFIVAGCSATDAAPVAAPSTTLTTSTAPAERLALAIGHSFDQYDGTGSTAELEATITLMSVDADPTCAYEDTELQADASQGGIHHVALELTVDATASDRPGFVNVHNFDVAEQLPEGLTSNSVAHSTERSSCLPDRPILDTVDSGTKVRGWMLFAVENATGSLLWLNGGESPGVTIAYAASPRTSTTTAASTTTTTAPRPAPTSTIAPTSTSAPAPAVSQPSAASTPEERVLRLRLQPRAGCRAERAGGCGQRRLRPRVQLPAVRIRASRESAGLRRAG